MLRITGTIEGVAPILFSRMYDQASLEGPGGPPAMADRLKEPWLKCHRDEHGIYIPGGMFKQAILGGAKAGDVKKGKRSWATLLEALVFPESHLYLSKENFDDVFEHWGRRPPKTGGAMIIRYPRVALGWRADFRLVCTLDDATAAEAVRRSIEAAGLLVGMGSWRPEYGRFVLVDYGVA